MSLSTTMSLALRAIQTGVADFSAPSDAMSLGGNLSWASGVGANQADRIYHDQRTLGASTAEDLDVSGALLDKFGAAFVLVKLKFLMVKAAAANGGNIEVGGDANSVPIFGAVADFLVVPPGGYFVWCAPALAGVAVTAGTGDIIQINNANGGGAGTYDIVIIGTSS